MNRNADRRSPSPRTSVKTLIIPLILGIGFLFVSVCGYAEEGETVKQEFLNPPAGYGEVPFWWWTGEKLDTQRLIWQLDQLHQAGISGVQVNYAHRDQVPWLTYPPEPEIFSDEWWNVYDAVAAACAERGMGIGVSGYTIDWQKTPGNLFSRIVYNNPETLSRNIILEKRVSHQKGDPISEPISNSPDQKTVAALFYPRQNGALDWTAGAELLNGNAEGIRFDGNMLTGTAPEEGELWLYAAQTVPNTLNPLHPDSGARVIENFFSPFETHSPTGSAEGLNYFFQDELQLGTGPLLWCDDLPEQFRARKGYSLFEALPAFFDENAGTADLGVKYHLDWYDVRVRLAEERYFQPIFNWHNSRGLIYACDPGSRGYNPFEFCDYYSAIRWYTAPGHDTPGGEADFIKNRVSSSIAHFCHRPRVWLEGYHSLGWGATPQRLFNATCENFIFGANLLNLHGLYYSTYGGWWEWAPPCYHFRMPYWRDFPVFLRYFERLSYMMSRGRQKADILIYYPVSEYQGAGSRGKEASDYAFAAAKQLAGAYYNILFVDDDSITRGAVEGDKLVIDGEAYSALILPNISAIRWNTFQRICQWQKTGGTIVALNTIPTASDRAGKNDPVFANAAAELFADPQTVIGTDAANLAPLVAFFAERFPRDVEPDSEIPLIYQHRTDGMRDIYAVKGAPKGTHLRFRTTGKAERWDPWTGKTEEILQYSHPAGDVTEIVMEGKTSDLQIIVFDRNEPARFDAVTTDLNSIGSITPPAAPDEPWRAAGQSETPGPKTLEVTRDGTKYSLTGTAPALPAPKEFGALWESEIVPALDNSYGDYRLPVEEQYIGPEARRFTWREEGAEKDLSPEETVTCGFGPKFLRLGPLPDTLSETQKEAFGASLADAASTRTPISFEGTRYDWQPYSFSWREGIEGNPGHEGYHGLKKMLDNRFIGLGKTKEGLNETLFVPDEAGNVNYLLTWVHAVPADEGAIIIKTEGAFPASATLAGTPITAGSRFRYSEEKQPLQLRYDEAGRYAFVLADESAPPRTEKATPLSMTWFEMPGRLDFDIYPDAGPAEIYRFLSPPGLESAVISAKAPVTVTSGGKEFQAVPLDEDSSAETAPYAPTGLDGSRRYRVRLDDGIKTPRTVEIRAAAAEGARGGAFFPEPIRLKCGQGEITLGNWNEQGVLETFSGGIVYRQKFELSAEEVRNRPQLNLGSLCASARVTINGADAGTLVTAPWQLDISEKVQEGENFLEIEVRNTLTNHYRTIPTRYRGDSPSGLFGPVRIEFWPNVELKSE